MVKKRKKKREEDDVDNIRRKKAFKKWVWEKERKREKEAGEGKRVLMENVTLASEAVMEMVVMMMMLVMNRMFELIVWYLLLMTTKNADTVGWFDFDYCCAWNQAWVADEKGKGLNENPTGRQIDDKLTGGGGKGRVCDLMLKYDVNTRQIDGKCHNVREIISSANHYHIWFLNTPNLIQTKMKKLNKEISPFPFLIKHIILS